MILLYLNIAVALIALVLKMTLDLFSIGVIFFVVPIIYSLYGLQPIKNHKRKESYFIMGVTTLLTIMALSSLR
ncbi:hypothetical protein M3557_02370 [Bhargavaea ginsengi]|uniref:hypothetical protein n=1 Tax=Bhargavaea ginsengi TaxID=426757 RepID=UPI00203D6104|nr:hypothetical protein [Bhargavaea ginsengi]MCM3086754.1 hypothetical protein [Bhargavaea ginsengi]